MAVKSEYIKTLTLSDMTMDTTVGVLTSGYVDLAVYQVPKDQAVFFGNGRINLGVDDRGTFKATFKSSGGLATMDGSIRLVLRDTNGIRQPFIRDDLAADVSTGVKVGKGGKTGNEGQLLFAKENYYLVLQAKADTAITVTKADSTMNLPVTILAL